MTDTKQHSTGGKARLGKTSKLGQSDIRTLLVSGAMAVLQAVERFDTPNNGWLKRLLARNSAGLEILRPCDLATMERIPPPKSR